jgi:hypothetical protein
MIRTPKSHFLLLLAAFFLLPLIASALESEQSAQVVGSVHEGRYAWNPFHPSNAMPPAGKDGFRSTLRLSKTGGRNRDGIYTMRFFTNSELRQVYKRGSKAGTLVTGPAATAAGNIVFQVSKDGDYTITFDPASSTYSISPAVEEQDVIRSMQLNGFVHDTEGNVECFDGRRTRPAEKWDEGVPSHELQKNPDGSWSIQIKLSATGGHEKNGVYQCLLSANNNSDWGYGAILGKPGKLAGGNGYESRVGHVEETAICFRVSKDGLYTITVWPEEYRFEISPLVDFFQKMEFQVDGNVVPDPWNPAAPGHDMERGEDGLWRKTLTLDKEGGSDGKGTYVMNFSIDGNWALDSIGFGGKWGKTWHSDPQEWNLLFRAPADGDYRVTLDPEKGEFSFDPPVEPITEISSLQLCGDFDQFAGDGKNGWNELDPMHDMQQQDDKNVFTKRMRLTGGKTYSYRFTANRTGWGWSLADYPYDGHRRLASHGSPPPITYVCPRDGDYLFTADVLTGEYSVVLLKHR